MHSAKKNMLLKRRGHFYHDDVNKLNLPVKRISSHGLGRVNTGVFDGSVSNITINSHKPIDRIMVNFGPSPVIFPGNGKYQMTFIQPEKWIPCYVQITVEPKAPILVNFDYVQHKNITLQFAVLPQNKLLYIWDKYVSGLRYTQDEKTIIPSSL